MTYNKLPGGEAQGMEKKDFSKKEQQAIDKGSKIEVKEHGKLAPEEIAADHVKESGPKYYDNKKGLPAMEKKLEQMEKADPRIKPAEISDVTKVAYDPNLSPAEHVARVKHHNKMASIESSKGNREGAMWHLLQGSKHHLAASGKPPQLETHVIKSEDLAKDVVNIKTGKQMNATPERVAAQPPAPEKRELKEVGAAPKTVAPGKGVDQEASSLIREKMGWTQKPQGVADKMKLGQAMNKQPESHEARVARIKVSLDKISYLMNQLKAHSGKKPELVKSKDYAPKIEEKEPIHKSIETDRCKSCGSMLAPDEYGQCQNCKDSGETDHEHEAEKGEYERDQKLDKSIQYSSGHLAKSKQCEGCGTQSHNQWKDTAKSTCCKSCGTPMKKSGLPEEMPDSVRLLNKSENVVRAAEAEVLQKAWGKKEKKAYKKRTLAQAKKFGDDVAKRLEGKGSINIFKPEDDDKPKAEPKDEADSDLKKAHYYRYPKKGHFHSPKEWDEFEPTPAQRRKFRSDAAAKKQANADKPQEEPKPEEDLKKGSNWGATLQKAQACLQKMCSSSSLKKQTPPPPPPPPPPPGSAVGAGLAGAGSQANVGKFKFGSKLSQSEDKKGESLEKAIDSPIDSAPLQAGSMDPADTVKTAPGSKGARGAASMRGAFGG